jgi:hypothetical protein
VVQTDTNSLGSTSLVEFSNNYYLVSASGTVPSLKYGGVPIVLDQGGWAPIGAVQTTTGYLVAWKEVGADQYTEWSVDSNGNYISNLITPEPGNSLSLENAETVFNQDLNGDRVIGVPAATGPAPTSSTAQPGPVTVARNDTFVFRSDLGAGSVTNTAGAVRSDGHSSFGGNEFSMLFHDAHAASSETPLQVANHGHDTVMGSGNHSSITPTNFHVGDQHASGFFFH